MLDNQRNTCYKIKEIFVKELEKYIKLITFCATIVRKDQAFFAKTAQQLLLMLPQNTF